MTVFENGKLDLVAYPGGGLLPGGRNKNKAKIQSKKNQKSRRAVIEANNNI